MNFQYSMRKHKIIDISAEGEPTIKEYIAKFSCTQKEVEQNIPEGYRISQIKNLPQCVKIYVHSV